MCVNLWKKSEKRRQKEKQDFVRHRRTNLWNRSERFPKKIRNYGKKMSLHNKLEKMKTEKWAKVWKKSEL